MRPLALLLVLSPVAYAQPSPPPKSEADKAEATRLAGLGTQARLRAEAAAALAYFEEAYLIFPMPRLHFEMGLAQGAMPDATPCASPSTSDIDPDAGAVAAVPDLGVDDLWDGRCFDAVAVVTCP